MRPRFALHFALTSTLAVALASACGSSGKKGDTGATGAGGSGAADAGADAAAAVTLRLDPTTASVTATLGAAPPAPVTFHVYATVGGAPEQDVTATAYWDVGASVGTVAAGVVTFSGNGGTTMVSATYEGATAQAPLTVLLTGDVYGTGTDATTKASFAGATPDPTAASAPSLEYPEDGVVLPANLPPIDAQWAQGAADNTTYRVHLASAGILDVYFYTTALDLVFPAAAFTTIGVTAADTPAQMTVEALGAGNALRTSLPRTFTVTADTIDDSAIYVWQSSTGTFRVLDVIAGTEIALPNDSPALAAGQPCSGCHRISRDGTRFSYTFNGGNFEFGSMAYDPKQGLFATKITPAVSFRATYATFNPNESTQVPAMLVSAPIQSSPPGQNVAGTVSLQLLNPDTGAPVMSNLTSAAAMIDPAVGLATSMPDWSPDGSFVVFAAYDSTKNLVRDLGDDIVAASIVEMPVAYDAASGFTFGAPTTLVQIPAGAADTPDTGQNNFLPAISPDGSAVAFTRAAGWWSIKTQQSLLNLSGQIAIVRRSDKQVFELINGSNGGGTTMSSTWPQWAPSLGSRYAWLAYASERPYGHLMSAQNPVDCGALVQGQNLCKHLWVTAIDLSKLANGTADPSSAPFWIPVQTLGAQYVSPQWTKAVIKPPT